MASCGNGQRPKAGFVSKREDGQGWVDATDRWTDRIRNEVVVFAQLVEVYERLNAENSSS
jgi:hypothetical protein